MTLVPASSKQAPSLALPSTSTGGTTTFTVDAAGDLILDNSDATGSSAEIALSDGSGGSTVIDTQSGISMTRVAAAATLLELRDHSNALALRLRENTKHLELYGAITTQPAASSASALALGSAYQNVLGYDAVVVVYLSVTANTSLVVQLGVGPTNTPTQQTIITGLTATGVWTVPIYLPDTYYALLSKSGTGTISIDGQIAMPV